jgi:hypothetical protein
MVGISDCVGSFEWIGVSVTQDYSSHQGMKTKTIITEEPAVQEDDVAYLQNEKDEAHQKTGLEIPELLI